MLKEIKIGRKKREVRVNEESIMTVPWQQKRTKNIIKMLCILNEMTEHKFNPSILGRFIAGEFSNAYPLWLDLNIMSREFAIVRIEPASGPCCCGQCKAKTIWRIRHRATNKELTFGNDCINRIFPSLQLVKYRKLITDIEEAVDNNLLPVLTGEALKELYFQVDPMAVESYVTSYIWRAARALKTKDVDLNGTYGFFMDRLVIFLGMKPKYRHKISNLQAKYNLLASDNLRAKYEVQK